MSLLRLLVRPSPTTAHILPFLRRPCTLRPQPPRKSLLPRRLQSPVSRPFASAPGPRAAAPKPKPAAGSGASPSSSARNAQQQELPERLLIYHAGTGRIAFLAFWKITTVFSCAFFCLVAAPSYIRSEDKTLLQAAGLAACGIVPFLFVSYTTAPFVTYIYLRLPPYARQSRAMLERFVRALPPAAQLELGTMGLATRPRTTLVSAADLRPVPRSAGARETRLGIVNYARDVSHLLARRSWHHYRPVGKFSVREDVSAGGKRGVSGSRAAVGGVKDGWVWNIIRESLGKKK